MLRQVMNFFVEGMIKCIDLTKTLVLDKVGNLNITYFSFLLFFVFIPIVLRLINFVKQIQEVEEEDKKGEYKKEKRYEK